jgi:hypothetical protein
MICESVVELDSTATAIVTQTEMIKRKLSRLVVGGEEICLNILIQSSSSP